MLFNSYEFVLIFLPITCLGFQLLAKNLSRRPAIMWLTAASLVFYGYWNPPYLFLLILSIGINYIIGKSLANYCSKNDKAKGKLLLFSGITFNLGLIAYYKYFNFFLDNVNSLVDTNFSAGNIFLPLGISFYTFQQISYLIDSLEGETKHYKFLDYCLFVTFFPQLIAGPIVTHQEMMPQFSSRPQSRVNQENLAIGLTIFSIGLFKKVILADQIALYSTPVFQAASQGVSLTIAEAWIGALAYTMQIYFDFSGYSDMAIGAARMFGIQLPLNFNSPYKAVNIIDFWGRWHITLTRFLTRYLYNPIVLNFSRKRVQQGKSLIKKGVGSLDAFLQLVAIPTIITMFLAGLWHGAGWQYIIFGLLHGCYLAINHGWHMFLRTQGRFSKSPSWLAKRAGQVITFLSVVIAMVFFRATNVPDALTILSSMVGKNGVSFADGTIFLNNIFPDPRTGVLWLIILMAVAFCFPNTQQWMSHFNPALNFQSTHKIERSPKWLTSLWVNLEWKPTIVWAGLTGFIGVTAFLGLGRISEFIYFQF